MSGDSLPSPGELAGHTVAQLKALLKERSLKVSGKKAELIDRLLGWGEEASEEVEEALILEDDGDVVFEAEVIEADDLESEVREIVQEFEEAAGELHIEDDEVFEAEILEAEFIDDEPITPDRAKPVRLVRPNLVETLTSPATGAVVLAVLLMAAGGFWYWSSHLDPFVADPIEFGDEMRFTITTGAFDIEGEEMIRELDRATNGALADICDEFHVDFTGSGSISVANGGSGELFSSDDSHLSGVVQARDAFGLTFLTVEQQLDHDLSATITSKSWLGDSSEGICSVPVGPIEGYSMSQSTKSWTELTSKRLLRTDTSLSLDNQGDALTVHAVSFGVPDDSLSKLVPELMLPLKPVELTTVFGSSLLEKGQEGISNGWRWVIGDTVTVGGEIGLRVNMQHIEIEDCIGWAHMSLVITPTSPWPVEQSVDIQLEKSSQNTNCGTWTEYLMDRALPDGQLSLSYTLTRTGSAEGSKLIDWTSGYAQRPSSGSGELTPDKNWGGTGLHMPDESTVRSWPLEDAVSCILNSSLSVPEAATALSTGGYVFRAEDDRTLGTTQWNVSWVDDDEAGWVIVEERTDNCSIIDDALYADAEEPAHRRESIPTTASLTELEERLIDPERYSEFTVLSTSNGQLSSDTTYGYHLQVPPEAGDLLDLLDGIQQGTVFVGGEREWEENGLSNHMRYTMDGTTGRMVGWVVTSTNT